jgi:hypothetical protein
VRRPSVSRRIRQEVDSSAAPFVPEAVQLLDTIPGIGETVAQIIVAEIGADMDCFPTANHLALHTTNFVPLALKGFAPRTSRKILDLTKPQSYGSR